jgi:RNA polymerase sigma-70 factor (ECF subfamily)
MRPATTMEIPREPLDEDPAVPAAADGASSDADAPEDGGAAEAEVERGPPPDPREQDLIRRAQAGEERAFEELVRAHQQRAFRIARNLVPSEDDARDLVQEAFLRVFRSLERFDFQYGFSTWLHRIVTNLAIDHLRRRRLVTQQASGEDDDTGAWEAELESQAPSPSERLESLETARKVRECIAALAPHFQAVLTLRELEGLPCTEIARIVGATHVTVRWRLHRGRKLFLEEWERRERAASSGAARGPAPDKSGGSGAPARNPIRPNSAEPNP